MAFSTVENGNKKQYGTKTYYLDTAADLAKLPKDDVVGSIALIIATSQIYFINSKGEWVMWNASSSSNPATAESYIFKGSVATMADLPAEASVGEVYNVAENGANYAWTGEIWDSLGAEGINWNTLQ